MLRSTLLAEGTSDRALLPILRRVLAEHWPAGFDDFGFLGSSVGSLSTRVLRAVREYPCDLLLVHRDADRVSYEDRAQEIRDAVSDAAVTMAPVVCVIPVREMEAWLMVDESAIRRAAGRPDGTFNLGLPPHNRVEVAPDSKELLNQALRNAAQLRGRRLKKFRPEVALYRIAELQSDLRLLRRLSAFTTFEGELAKALQVLRREPRFQVHPVREG